MGRFLVLLAVAGALAGCGQQPRAGSSAPPGISYRFEGDNIAEANQRAHQYCQQYGKRALLRTISHSGSDNIAVYDCS